MSSIIYIYGSGECEQLGKSSSLTQQTSLTFLRFIGLEFGEDDLREVKRPKKISLFDMSGALELKVPVCKLVCGGMHTAVLTPAGAVYTWGCNDEGALGRIGIEDKPMHVDTLPIRCTDLAVGDSHTVFYNSETSQAYFCGLYRVRYPLA